MIEEAFGDLSKLINACTTLLATSGFLQPCTQTKITACTTNISDKSSAVTLTLTLISA